MVPTKVRRTVVDLRATDPTEWRRSFNSTFDELGDEDSFVLVSDHRPGAILAGCRAECGDEVVWNALCEGPGEWRFEIVKWSTGGPRTITSFLSVDHDRLDDIFERLQTAARAGDSEAATLFGEFCTGLERHIRMEEEVLFPVFEKRTGMTQGPTQVMRMEHIEIKKTLEAISASLADGQVLDEHAGRLLEVLGPHNDKEEQILYPGVDQTLSEAERVELIRAMQSL